MRDQDKRAKARSSGEFQVPGINHQTQDSFLDCPDNDSSFYTEDHMARQEHLACF